MWPPRKCRPCSSPHKLFVAAALTSFHRPAWRVGCLCDGESVIRASFVGRGRHEYGFGSENSNTTNSHMTAMSTTGSDTGSLVREICIDWLKGNATSVLSLLTMMTTPQKLPRFCCPRGGVCTTFADERSDEAGSLGASLHATLRAKRGRGSGGNPQQKKEKKGEEEKEKEGQRHCLLLSTRGGS